jgi:hypothetical protein
VLIQVARVEGGNRRLEEVAMLERSSGEVSVRPVWQRDRGWTGNRVLLEDLLRRRGVRPSW